MTLSSSALETFGAVADTLLPPVEGQGDAWSMSATDLGVSARVTDIYGLLPSDRARKDLRQLFRLMGSPVGGMVLYGKPTKFTGLSPLQRIDALRAMSTSRLGPARQGFKALKLLAGFLFTTPPAGSEACAAWDAMGYPGPDGKAPDTPKTITPLRVSVDTELRADVVIVGSGAGGGVAAGVLAAAGLDVLVLEKGEYRNEADFTHVEPEAYKDMYLDGALSGTVDGGVSMLAGSTLGGGTVINYTTSFATPQAVRAEWDRVASFADVFAGPEYQAASRAVHDRLGVNIDHNVPAVREQLMDKGLRSLGWHVEPMPRNVIGCVPEACGYCTMGCRVGAKQSTLTTYLQDAADAGARFVVGADVSRVITEAGAAAGVVAQVGRAELTVRARAVVLAAGALNTPAILLRSKLGGKAVGRYLHLYPATAVWGRLDEPVDPWTGILQALYSDEFADLDGEGHGFKFETAPVHPIFPASFLGWEDGASFKRDILGLRHLTPIGILVRDRDSGRVKIRRDGSVTWHYRPSNRDVTSIREGVRRAAQLLAEIGASEVLASTQRTVRWKPALGGSLDDFASDVETVGYG